MKKLYAVLVVLLFSTAARAQEFVFDSIGVQSITIGRITQKADTWVIRVDRPNGYDDFWPVNLPAQFAVPGQEVVFEGARGRIPMNVRLVGTPVKLSMIRVLYRTQPSPDKKGEVIPQEKEKPAAQVETDSVGYLDKQLGKIIQVNDVYLIECVLGDEVKRYVPDYMPDDFKVAENVITFSAVILNHDLQVRMMGTPVRIKELMMEEEVAFDENLVQQSLKAYFPFDSVGVLPETTGVIKRIADTYVIEVHLEGTITRYLPVILPPAFQEVEKAVIISGTIGRIPANVRLMGTPLTISTIKNK